VGQNPLENFSAKVRDVGSRLDHKPAIGSPTLKETGEKRRVGFDKRSNKSEEARGGGGIEGKNHKRSAEGGVGRLDLLGDEKDGEHTPDKDTYRGRTSLKNLKEKGSPSNDTENWAKQKRGRTGRTDNET